MLEHIEKIITIVSALFALYSSVVSRRNKKDIDGVALYIGTPRARARNAKKGKSKVDRFVGIEME